MIIILNGSIGIGKTSVSRKINERLDDSVMLEGDYLGIVNPFEIYDENRIEYLYQTITHLIKFHKDNGYDNFVINYVFETNNDLQKLVHKLEILDEKISCYWLICTEEEQRKRILSRNNNQIEWELKRAIELNRILYNSSQIEFIGEKIGTDNMVLDEIAEIIILKTLKKVN
ncbi:MAG: AAA family ATPase [Flavobacteriaceae bacterium]|nr:AAA family ATPase [Flavobacteriaceae bacterium]